MIIQFISGECHLLRFWFRWRSHDIRRQFIGQSLCHTECSFSHIIWTLIAQNKPCSIQFSLIVSQIQYLRYYICNNRFDERRSEINRSCSSPFWFRTLIKYFRKKKRTRDKVELMSVRAKSKKSDWSYEKKMWKLQKQLQDCLETEPHEGRSKPIYSFSGIYGAEVRCWTLTADF